jgi:DNA repair protein RadC
MKRKEAKCQYQWITAMMQLPLMVREPNDPVLVRTPEDTARIFSDIRDLAQEVFGVIVVNGKNRMLGRAVVTVGIADASLVHPREVYTRVLSYPGACALVLVHNHPSGDTTPSAEDIRITRQLIEAGKILAVNVLDHVIIGRKTDTSVGHMSMRECGLCEFGGTT